ncbi:MAG TPA: hypothetical protein VGG34_07330 [Opitutaceae bacterium]|jgi:hypothetical protein
MSNADPAKGQRAPLTRAQVRLYVIGYAILILGAVGSCWVYRTAVTDDLADALAADAYNTKAVQGQMQYIGGNSDVFATEVQNWFVSLWHGRNLAYTLAVISVGSALVCFYLAFALPDMPPFPDGNEPRPPR